MPQAIIPNKTSLPAGSRDLPSPSNDDAVADDPVTSKVLRMVSENAVIIIGGRGCCMCHVVKRLLQPLGVNPAVYELQDDQEAAVVAGELSKEVVTGFDDGGEVQFPVVFVGGKLLGGLERVMATHISGDLVPILKNAGALWL
ncbi:hypothetical protein QN277_006043 [Acacia crassicarpa]|uniref:Glutaredoxin domain-containing protein n=1 Tax=Acacia crassicarpa TaxID=499986 RepID=A0AAE1IZJ9_9FABA|nr:hypothetical protein QN277_006043 [Acacia crassicarpa]